MNLSKLIEATTTVAFDYGGETVTLEVYSNSLTPASLGRLRRFESDGPEATPEILAPMIKSWDVTLGEEDFPPTAENLARCPMQFLTEVFEAIGRTWSGNAPTPTGSPDSSAASERRKTKADS